MSTSQVSKQVFVIDVPEINDFTANFQYNYFVKDEQTTENFVIPNILLKNIENNSVITQNSTYRVPRLITLQWKISNNTQLLADGTNVASQKSNTTKKLISNNFDKIIFEDALTYENFLGLTFQNNNIGQEMYSILSGTQRSYSNDDIRINSDNTTRQQLYLESITPDGVNPEFVNVALGQPLISKGINYTQNVKVSNKQTLLEKLKNVKIGAQVNTKFLSNMLDVAKVNLTTTNYANFNNISSFVNKLNVINTQNNMTLSDYQTFLPYVDVINGASNHTSNSTELVGFVIDKSELLTNGKIINKDSIIIDNSKVNQTFDFQIKYNSHYIYQIRSIYKMFVPAIDDTTGDVVLLVVLVSSKPSPQSHVTCVENISPPPVNDLDFVWDYTRINSQTNKPGNLMIHWTFPINSQRDIKYFQIFRRRSIENAFELIKMYHFNDADIQPQLQEQYDVNVVERLSSPITYFIDDEFIKTSKYIYTVCTMDAHGYISNYGEQFEVWFDRVSNSLQKKLISHSGAFRSYPNLYIENDLFVDAIKTSGIHSKKMKIYFNPEYYRLYDEQGQNMNLLQTTQNNGKYKFQLINVDNQQDISIDINIDDSMGVTEESYVRGSRFWG